MIEVTIEPDGTTLELPQARSVLQLLNKTNRKSTRTLVIRNHELLTQDRKLFPGDKITLRDVTSRG